MCTTRAAKPQTTSSEQKPVQYLTNPYLDSQLYRSAAIGRNALRIDPTGPRLNLPRMSNPLPPTRVGGPGNWGGGGSIGTGGNGLLIGGNDRTGNGLRVVP